MLDIIDKIEGRRCCKCESSDTYIQPNGTPSWYGHKCDKADCTGWLCRNCYRMKYYFDKEKFDPNSQANTMKSLAHVRTGQIDKYDNKGKGLIHEFVVMKIRKVKNYNIESNNFNSKYDLLPDPEYGLIQVKGPKLRYGGWKTKFGREHNFDVLLILCKSKDEKDIERVYIIHKSELYGITSLEIPKNPRPSIGSKWERFKLEDLDIKMYNDVYQDLMIHLKDKRYFSIKDLEEWLNKDIKYY